MKTVRILSIIGLFFVGLVSCQGNQKSAEAFDNHQRDMGAKVDGVFDEMEEGEIIAYYFHATRRCATCQAVEQVTKETIEANFADKVNFESINREEEKDNPLIEKYKINGQTLIIVKGDEVINLTNEAFMNARSNPEKFEVKLKETIEGLL